MGKIEAADQRALHRRLDIAALRVVGVARQGTPSLDRVDALGENCDPVPAPLPMPHGSVPGGLNGRCRELVVASLELLEADHIRLGCLEPPQQDGKPAGDAIDVEGGDLHGLMTRGLR